MEEPHGTSTHVPTLLDQHQDPETPYPETKSQKQCDTQDVEEEDVQPTPYPAQPPVVSNRTMEEEAPTPFPAEGHGGFALPPAALVPEHTEDVKDIDRRPTVSLFDDETDPPALMENELLQPLATVETSAVETLSGETQAGKTPASETKADETMAIETLVGQTPAGVTQGGETPAGVTQGGETPAGVIEGGETPAGVTQGGETPAGVTQGGEPPAGETLGGGTPAGETKADETPAIETLVGETQAGQPLAGGAPAFEEQVAPKNEAKPIETPKPSESVEDVDMDKTGQTSTISGQARIETGDDDKFFIEIDPALIEEEAIDRMMLAPCQLPSWGSPSESLTLCACLTPLFVQGLLPEVDAVQLVPSTITWMQQLWGTPGTSECKGEIEQALKVFQAMWMASMKYREQVQACVAAAKAVSSAAQKQFDFFYAKGERDATAGRLCTLFKWYGAKKTELQETLDLAVRAHENATREFTSQVREMLCEAYTEFQMGVLAPDEKSIMAELDMQMEVELQGTRGQEHEKAPV